MAPTPTPGWSQRLTLLSWLHDLLGYADTKHLLDDIRPAQ